MPPPHIVCHESIVIAVLPPIVVALQRYLDCFAEIFRANDFLIQMRWVREDEAIGGCLKKTKPKFLKGVFKWILSVDHRHQRDFPRSEKIVSRSMSGIGLSFLDRFGAVDAQKKARRMAGS